MAKTKAHGPREQVIQRQVMCWLESVGIFAWYVKSTGTYDPVRKCFRRPPRYFRTGVPDVHIVQDGVYLAIELKTPRGRLSDNQWLFRDRFEEEVAGVPNIHYYRATSLEQVQMICREHGLN